MEHTEQKRAKPRRTIQLASFSQWPVSLWELLAQLSAFAAGFLLAQTKALGSISPFAMAFATAAPRPFGLLSAAGTCLGYLSALDEPVLLMRYLVATVSAVAVRSVCARFFPEAKAATFAAAAAFACSLATGLTVLWAQGLELGGLLQFGCDAVLAGGMCWFFAGAFRTAQYGKSIYRTDRREMAGLILCISVLLMALGEYRFWSVTPAHILGGLLVLSAAYVAAEAGGGIAGICVGLALAAARGGGLALDIGNLEIAGGNPGIAVFCAGGLLAGLFSSLGQLGTAVAFVLVSGIAAVLEGNAAAVALLFETATASVIFVALPKRPFSEAQKLLRAGGPGQPSEEAREIASQRLREAARAIGSVSVCVDTVAQGLDQLDFSDPELSSEAVRARVCESCAGADFCWGENLERTREAFREALSQLTADGHMDSKSFPQAFQDSCVNTARLAVEYNRLYLSQVAQQGARQRARQMRDVVADQFQGMAEILEELSCELSLESVLLPETTTRSKQALNASGLHCRAVKLLRDSLGRISLRAEVAHPPEATEYPKLLRELRAATGVELERPQIEELERGVSLLFPQRMQYRVRLGAVQSPSEPDSVCGDYFECFQDSRGREILILSDGMGTGSRAAIDAAMATELFAKLVRAGLDFPCALRIVNTALLIKSAEESLATLDVACVDLYSGKADFYKAGAAASFVRHKHKAAALEQPSLPAGILRDIRFADASAALTDGDVLVLVSDGILTEGGAAADSGGAILQLLRGWEGSDAQALAEEIAALTESGQTAAHRDDVTVIAAMIEEI